PFWLQERGGGLLHDPRAGPHTARAMGGKKSYQNYGKTFRKPKRPFEKERLDSEMKIVGEYGLKNKREVWRVQYALAKIRTAARHLLTLDEKSEQRMFQGEALLRRMIRIGLLMESEKKLDYVLGLTSAKIMERRLQTKVFKLGLAKSIHHARVLIRQLSASASRSATSRPSWCASTARSTSTSPSPPRSAAAGPAACAAR
ncbi:unnamed protein product, partial [Prorocentrum cordatum]